MSLGYFLQDFAVLVHTRELGGTYQLLFHHSSAVFAYLLGMVSSLFTIISQQMELALKKTFQHYNVLGWYSAYRLMAEFSTPFVNIR